MEWLSHSDIYRPISHLVSCWQLLFHNFTKLPTNANSFQDFPYIVWWCCMHLDPGNFLCWMQKLDMQSQGVSSLSLNSFLISSRRSMDGIWLNLLWIRYRGFLSHGGTPRYHPFTARIFHEGKDNPFWHSTIYTIFGAPQNHPILVACSLINQLFWGPPFLDHPIWMFLLIPPTPKTAGSRPHGTAVWCSSSCLVAISGHPIGLHWLQTRCCRWILAMAGDECSNEFMSWQFIS